MAEEENFSRPVSVAKNACPDCAWRKERKGNDFSAIGEDKYRCVNPECPGKQPRKEQGHVRKSDEWFGGGRNCQGDYAGSDGGKTVKRKMHASPKQTGVSDDQSPGHASRYGHVQGML